MSASPSGVAPVKVTSVYASESRRGRIRTVVGKRPTMAWRCAIEVFERVRQIHETAALGVDRTAGVREGAHGVPHGLVRGEGGRVQLRVAAAEVEPVDTRQRAIGERLQSTSSAPAASSSARLSR
jgi:hypothetical protein